MPTPKTESPVETETLEQIAERVVDDNLDTYHYTFTRRALITAVLSALRNRDERAVRIINEHQALDKCEDNCWTTIKAAIREGK